MMTNNAIFRMPNIVDGISSKIDHSHGNEGNEGNQKTFGNK